MGRGPYAQRSSEGGSAGGDVTGVTGSNHISVTNPGGPVPNVASDGTLASTASVLVARGASREINIQSVNFVNSDASAGGSIVPTIGGFLTIANGAGSPTGLFLNSSGVLYCLGPTGITLETSNVLALYGPSSITYSPAGTLSRTDTPSATGNWTEVYTAKVDNKLVSYARRDEDTAAAGYTWTTQQPQAGSTGTNRDSGSAVIQYQTPEAEASGGRWGQSATQWPSASVEDREHHGVINTTDATVTSVLGAQSNALPASSSATIFLKFKVRNTTTDASRTVIKIMHWGRTGAAAPTQRGATVTVFDDGDAIAVTTTAVATGNAIVPQFTGVAATNLRCAVEMVVSLES